MKIDSLIFLRFIDVKSHIAVTTVENRTRALVYCFYTCKWAPSVVSVDVSAHINWLDNFCNNPVSRMAPG